MESIREIYTSKEWFKTEPVDQAENSLNKKDIDGVTAVVRQWIGATKTVSWSRSDQKERRASIQSEVRRAVKQASKTRKCRIVGGTGSMD